MDGLTNPPSIALPTGFSAGSHASGIKPNGALDVGVVVSDRPAQAAGLFTTNRVQAAPVVLSRKHLQEQRQTMYGLVLNSCNANAVTGAAGHRHAFDSAVTMARCCAVLPEQVLVLSTGVIGVPLPIDRLLPGIEQACAQRARHGGPDLAKSMMTTDTCPKSARFEGGGYTIQAFAKGSGMIHPNMATMLAVVLTDALLSADELDHALREANRLSFNRISVDGDTSTNDAVIALANGASGVRPAATDFLAGLTQVCTQLAKAIVRDGEGAGKLIDIRVDGAVNEQEAEQAAKGIATSLLFKTAMFGCDANWGRVLSALGQSGAHFDLERLRLAFGPITVMADGEPQAFDEAAATDYLRGQDISVHLTLGLGRAEARVWTCDLSHEYVTINGSYRS